ncbi:unnamed protein product [Acanthoscelides obtectus]|uniref:Uncharacterized protein n=1 Tax=Acanthoscelides obtectus TaxID=200917 RepID=A0A9P0P8H1_ACAOB|nr:unnamed protein product [Acanthoscelides obtectus]CAK1647583.1 hypothetical protein AOBTE_LOCUS15281 [Acanthoscelides obtectus]
MEPIYQEKRWQCYSCYKNDPKLDAWSTSGALTGLPCWRI